MNKFEAFKSGTFALSGKKRKEKRKKNDKGATTKMAGKKRIITKSDLAILETINRFGYMTVKEIAEISERQEKPVYTRLKALCDHGLLNHRRMFYATAGAYWLTHEGKNACYSELTPIKELNVATFNHGLKVVGVYIGLKKRYGEKLIWITDREILSSKVMNASTFKGAFQALKSKVPDGIAVYENRKFAVEVELSLKGRNRMKKIIENYVTALKNNTFQGILYYTGEPRVRKRLEETIADVAGTLANHFQIEALKE